MRKTYRSYLFKALFTI